MRSLPTLAAAWTLAALCLTGPRALAGEDRPAQAPEDPVGVRWIEGFEAGREKAAHTGRLMLVYVHRTSPH